MFSTGESELNHMRYGLKVGEGVLWKYNSSVGQENYAGKYGVFPGTCGQRKKQFNEDQRGGE